MQSFIVVSLIGSIVLTVIVNLWPVVFPKSSAKLARSVHDKITETGAKQEQGDQPRGRVFFPWKAMLIVSVGLTIMGNVMSFIASR